MCLWYKVHVCSCVCVSTQLGAKLEKLELFVITHTPHIGFLPEWREWVKGARMKKKKKKKLNFLKVLSLSFRRRMYVVLA